MRFLADSRLYYDTAYCLAFARKLPAQSPRPQTTRNLFHFYWYGPFNRKVVFALKSFLATQDPERAEAWLWLDYTGTRPDSQEAFAAALGGEVRILTYDPPECAVGTPLATAPTLLTPQDPVARSDAFRLLILYRHGGVYVDMDTMFLRDFGVLFDTYGDGSFCYRWSARQHFGTNAIMYMERANPLGLELIRRCIEIGSCKTRLLLRHEHADIDLLELPCVLFDPLWPHFDREDRFAKAPFKKFRDFFRPFGLLHRRKQHIRSMADFFPGAFAYQWHGFWNMTEYEESYFGMFEREIDTRLSSPTSMRY